VRAPPSLTEALAAARRGDEEGFRVLYTRYRGEGTAMLKAAYPRLDQAARDDLLQEAFLEVLAQLDRIRKPESFGRWFFSVLLRGAWWRRRKGQREAEVLTAYVREAPEPDIAELTRRALRIRTVREVIEATPDELTRRIARMFYSEERPRAEIAERLGLTEAAVRTRLFRFRKQMNGELVRRVLLLEEEPLPPEEGA